MPDQFSRTRMLIGEDGVERLSEASVAVFGLGGVGSWCAEALARAGVGHLIVVDDDTVGPTNLNRQLVALHSTIGLRKTAVMARRVKDINPACRVETLDLFYGPETADAVEFAPLSYVVDAIDTVTAKLLLVERCRAAGTPVISAMGTGNKRDPGALTVTDIYQTATCPLARIMRKELRRRGIDALKVVYSTEPPLPAMEQAGEDGRSGPDTRRPGRAAERPVPGSMPTVPPAAGLLLASVVIEDLLK